MASGADSHKPVDPSMSVKRNVTVPDGAAVPMARASHEPDQGRSVSARQVPRIRARRVRGIAGSPPRGGHGWPWGAQITSYRALDSRPQTDRKCRFLLAAVEDRTTPVSLPSIVRD